MAVRRQPPAGGSAPMASGQEGQQQGRGGGHRRCWKRTRQLYGIHRSVPERRHPALPRSVGATGFEPAISCSQSRRDTRLRYAPRTFVCRKYSVAPPGRKTLSLARAPRIRLSRKRESDGCGRAVFTSPLFRSSRGDDGGLSRSFFPRSIWGKEGRRAVRRLGALDRCRSTGSRGRLASGRIRRGC